MFALPQFKFSKWKTIIYDTYFKYVSLLINADNASTGTQNNTFVDSSTNNFTITTSGTPAQGSFTPFYPNGWSGYFDGASRVTAPAGSNFAYGTGAFTIEAWIKPSSFTAGPIIFSQSTSTINYFVFSISSAAQLRLTANISGTGTAIVATSETVPLNQWSHVALVREGTGTNQLKFYINGVLAGTGTTAVDFTDTTRLPSIGAYTHTFATNAFTGHISNLRVIKGQALYTGAFTPATSPLTSSTVGATGANVAASITGTVSLLTLQDSRFKDNGGSSVTISTAGAPQILPINPFLNGITYSPLVHGGSIYFDGSSQFNIADNAAFAMGSANFTAEAWVYPTTLTLQQMIMGQWSGLTGSTTLSWALMLSNDANRYLRLSISTDGSAVANDLVTTSALQLNAWNHVCVVRNNTVTNGLYTLYLNGQVCGNGTVTNAAALYDATNNITIGNTSTGVSRRWTGYMSNVRIVKGTPVYTEAFTPSTAPLEAIANTSLLVRGNNAAIIDAAGKNTITAVSNAQVDTTTKKTGSGSLKFNGTSDYISIPANESVVLASGTPFTIEGWFYPTTVNTGTGTKAFISKRLSLSGYLCYEQGNPTLANAGYLSFYNGTTGSTSTAKFTVNTWNHVAYVYDGTNLSIYKDGSRVFGPTAVSITNSATTLKIGYDQVDANAYFTGYMDEVRITKGVARYSGASFTVPALANPTQ